MSAQSTLFDAAERKPALSQWYTPPWVADRMVRWVSWTHLVEPLSVLEPSAGDGALIRALARSEAPVGWLTAYEIDASRHEDIEAAANALRKAGVRSGWAIHGDDFLAAHESDPDSFHVALMNPPYENNQAVEHATKALDLCECVIGLFPASILHSKGRAEFWRWTDIRRMAALTERPKCGGEYTPQIDFLGLRLTRRKHARLQGDAAEATYIEWWSKT